MTSAIRMVSPIRIRHTPCAAELLTCCTRVCRLPSSPQRFLKLPGRTNAAAAELAHICSLEAGAASGSSTNTLAPTAGRRRQWRQRGRQHGADARVAVRQAKSGGRVLRPQQAQRAGPGHLAGQLVGGRNKAVGRVPSDLDAFTAEASPRGRVAAGAGGQQDQPRQPRRSRRSRRGARDQRHAPPAELVADRRGDHRVRLHHQPPGRTASQGPPA